MRVTAFFDRHPTLRRVTVRLMFLPVAVFVLMTIAFLIVNLVPSDPARVVLGALTTPQQIAQFNKQEGLTGSTWSRYLRYVDHVFHGSLGHSYYDGSSVLRGIWGHLASTLELVILAFIVAWVLGVALGTLSAYFRGSWIDSAVRGLVSVIQSVPDFVIGLLGASLLAFTFKLLPAPLGQLPVSVTPPTPITGAALVDSVLRGDWSAAWSVARQTVLPVLALGIFNSVVFARTVRTTMTDALDSPYVQFGRSRGLRETTIVRLALRSSLVPTITYSGVVVASLISGTAVVETAFSWQGLGQWAITGILRSDLPVAEGFVMVSGVFVVLIYLLSDIVTLVVDPRLRTVGAPAMRLGMVAEPALQSIEIRAEEARVDDFLVEDPADDRTEGREEEAVAALVGSPSFSAVAIRLGEESETGAPPRAPMSARLTSPTGPPSIGGSTGPGGLALTPATSGPPGPIQASRAVPQRTRRLRQALNGGKLQIGVGLSVVLVLVLAAFFAPLPHNPSHPYPQYTLVGPGARFWLGTDSTGYDVFARVIAGFKTDVPIALAGALIGAAVGTPLGLLVSVENRWTETVMRLVDLIQSLPVVLVAVVLAATSQGGDTGVIAAIALVNAPLFIRVVRAGALSVRKRRFVEAAHAGGVSPTRIALRHVLPNIFDLVLAQLSISIGFAILAIAALSYLGAGLSPTTPTWGGMINDGAKVLGIGKWWTVVVPAFAIAITVFSFNLVADGLQRMFSGGGSGQR